MTLAHQIQLFSRHANDLCDVGAATKELFICPICSRVLSREDLEAGLTDVGHVWPQFIRQKSDPAKQQQVLLCKRCNSKAGMRADAAMQEVERIHELMKSGASQRPVSMRVFQPKRPDLKPIGVRGFVEPGERHINIIFETPRTIQQSSNYQAMITRIDQFLHEGPISVATEPPVSVELAQVGWLTSAYLFAFYRFGYRYVLQSSLDPVREQINNSLYENNLVDPDLGKVGRRDIGVYRWDEVYCPHPAIGLYLSFEEDTPHHLQINFLSCNMRLPLPRRIESITVNGSTVPPEIGRAMIDASSDEAYAKIDWRTMFGEVELVVENRRLVRRS